MGLKDILFGKEKLIPDDKLGTFKTRVKKTNPSVTYAWASESIIEGQTKETVIFLEGNAAGPYKKQLESAYSLVDSLKEIEEKIFIEAKRQNLNRTKYKADWMKSFYLAAITPIDVMENSFEVEFDPINETDDGYILFTWKRNRVFEIEIK